MKIGDRKLQLIILLVFFIDQTATLSSPPVINAIFQNVNTSLFVRYSGGLTTPGCNEVVQWTVFTEKIAISSAQVSYDWFSLFARQRYRTIFDNQSNVCLLLFASYDKKFVFNRTDFFK